MADKFLPLMYVSFLVFCISNLESRETTCNFGYWLCCTTHLCADLVGSTGDWTKYFYKEDESDL